MAAEGSEKDSIEDRIGGLLAKIAKAREDQQKIETGDFATEGEAVAARRNVMAMSWNEKQLERERVWTSLVNSERLSGEALAALDKDPNHFPIPTINTQTGERYCVGMKLSQATVDELSKVCFEVPDSYIRSVMSQAEAESLLRVKLEDPKQFIISMIVRMSNGCKPINEWVHKQCDNSHPLYLPDGTLDRTKLPEGFTAAEWKGAGEAPVAEDDVKLLPVAHDNWFWTKFVRQSPLDRRGLGGDYEYDNQSRFGIVLKYVQLYIDRYWKMVRPRDADSAYGFDLEADVPFEGTPVLLDAAQLQEETDSYVIGKFFGKMLGNVPSSDGPERIMSHAELIKQAHSIKTLKTFAEGLNKDEDKQEKSIA